MILYQTFVVFVLWKKDGSKKWFPSVVGGGENPKGPVKKIDISIFCLGIREIVQSDFGKKLPIIHTGKVQEMAEWKMESMSVCVG